MMKNVLIQKRKIENRPVVNSGYPTQCSILFCSNLISLRLIMKLKCDDQKRTYKTKRKKIELR